MAERDLVVTDAELSQQGLGLGAELAADAGQDGNLVRLLGVRVNEIQQGVGIGHLERVAGLVRLDELLHDHAILDQHRVAPGALAEAEVALVDQQAHAFGEGAVAVWNQGDVVGLLLGAPLGHDEGVVD